MRFGLLALVALSAALSPPALGLAQSDWPCVQRKVEEVSLAAAWQGPEIDPSKLGELRRDPSVRGLVELLAQRRTTAEEAKAAIAQFAVAAGERKKEMLAAVVVGVFEALNAERADIIAGIERFGRKLKDFAEQVRQSNARLDAMRADAKADSAKLVELNDEVVWELRVFDERQRSLRFVCEVPTIVEQRLFTLSRLLQAAMS